MIDWSKQGNKPLCCWNFCYAIRSLISIARCAIKMLNQQKRFTYKTTFFYNSCYSMAPTARFCGFPQGSNQEEFHSGKLQVAFHLAN